MEWGDLITIWYTHSLREHKKRERHALSLCLMCSSHGRIGWIMTLRTVFILHSYVTFYAAIDCTLLCYLHCSRYFTYISNSTILSKNVFAIITLTLLQWTSLLQLHHHSHNNRLYTKCYFHCCRYFTYISNSRFFVIMHLRDMEDDRLVVC